MLCAAWWWCFRTDEKQCAGQLCEPTGEKPIAGEEGVWYEGTGAPRAGREYERVKGRGVPGERGKDYW